MHVYGPTRCKDLERYAFPVAAHVYGFAWPCIVKQLLRAAMPSPAVATTDRHGAHDRCRPQLSTLLQIPVSTLEGPLDCFLQLSTRPKEHRHLFCRCGCLCISSGIKLLRFILMYTYVGSRLVSVSASGIPVLVDAMRRPWPTAGHASPTHTASVHRAFVTSVIPFQIFGCLMLSLREPKTSGRFQHRLPWQQRLWQDMSVHRVYMTVTWAVNAQDTRVHVTVAVS